MILDTANDQYYYNLKDIRHQTSDIRHQKIRHQTSDIKHQTSKNQTSDIRIPFRVIKPVFPF